MSFSTLMVRMDLQASNAAVLSVAADLATRFKADVVGIAVAQPMQLIYSEGYVDGSLFEQDRLQKQGLIHLAEEQFRAAMGGRVANIHWLADGSPLSVPEYLANAMRCADLLITGPTARGSTPGALSQAEMGELVIRVGRPVLLVPHDTEQIDLTSAVIGWRDTREVRRAAVDALPLLRLAGRVTVAEIVPKNEVADANLRLTDVAAWLGRHGVEAHACALPASGDDAGRLDELAQDQHAGLLVVGAYGHNRVREWMLGGVTRALLAHPARLSLLSH